MAKPTSRLLKIRAFLVVMFILIVVAFFGLVACHLRGKEVERSNREKLKDVWLGICNYEALHGSLPPAYLTDGDGTAILSWRFLIHQFLENTGLPFDSESAWNASPNKLLRESGMTSRFTLHSVSIIGKPSSELVPYAILGEGTAFTSEKPLAALPPYLVIAIAAPKQGTNWMAPVDLTLDKFLSSKGSLTDVLNSLETDDIYILHANGEISMLSAKTPLRLLRPYLKEKAKEER